MHPSRLRIEPVAATAERPAALRVVDDASGLPVATAAIGGAGFAAIAAGATVVADGRVPAVLRAWLDAPTAEAQVRFDPLCTDREALLRWTGRLVRHDLTDTTASVRYTLDTVTVTFVSHGPAARDEDGPRLLQHRLEADARAAGFTLDPRHRPDRMTRRRGPTAGPPSP